MPEILISLLYLTQAHLTGYARKGSGKAVENTTQEFNYTCHTSADFRWFTFSRFVEKLHEIILPVTLLNCKPARGCIRGREMWSNRGFISDKNLVLLHTHLESYVRLTKASRYLLHEVASSFVACTARSSLGVRRDIAEVAIFIGVKRSSWLHQWVGPTAMPHPHRHMTLSIRRFRFLRSRTYVGMPRAGRTPKLIALAWLACYVILLVSFTFNTRTFD